MEVNVINHIVAEFQPVLCPNPKLISIPVFCFAALLQPNLLSLPGQSPPGLLQHQSGLALTPQVGHTFSCKVLHVKTRSKCSLNTDVKLIS